MDPRGGDTKASFVNVSVEEMFDFAKIYVWFYE